MKCKICGHRANSLSAMRDHYYKQHPDAMKRRKSRKEARVTGTKKGTIHALINEIEGKLEELESRI